METYNITFKHAKCDILVEVCIYKVWDQCAFENIKDKL